MIAELFPSALVPKVFGVESLVWALAAFAGPALSGVLTETMSWRAAFTVNMPIDAIFVALVLLVVPWGVRTGREGRLLIVRLLLIGIAYGASWACTSQTIMEEARPGERCCPPFSRRNMASARRWLD